jgi:hypothetical protein
VSDADAQLLLSAASTITALRDAIMTADTFEYYSKAVNGNIAGTADQQ